MKEAGADPHEGRPKCESNWMVHRIHYEKNRFMYDMYYKEKKVGRRGGGARFGGGGGQ